MCGICGWVGRGPEADGAAIVRAMADAIAHRGPDGDGFAPLALGAEDCGWFGHRRLRILDLSDAAAQPMWSRDGRVALLLNGEIYNFATLRQELRSRGHPVRSTGDTEVALRAYEEWGSGFLTRLDGMFALAVWDAGRGRLLLARDRAGKKPLFYVHAGRRLTFASEIKSLARCPWLELKPSPRQLAAFLTFGYVPYPSTIYEDVAQMEPGAVLEYIAAEDEVRVSRFWSHLPRGGPRRADRQLLTEISERAEDAVDRRLASDVPVGALLSGGIDSSVVTGLMARAAGSEIETFSVGFPEVPSFDESRHARAVADHFGTRHFQFSVDVDAASLLDELVWLHDGPFADSSALPTYLVCAAARSRVTVVLTGDGGDEVFGGYQRFAAAALSRLTTPAMQSVLRRALPMVPSTYGRQSPRQSLERFLATIDRSLPERYLGWISVFDRDLVSATLNASTDEVWESEAAFLDRYAEGLGVGLPPVDAILHANFVTYLPDDLLVKIDRMSMAHSLEARAPFLDTALVELMARVPARHKVGFRSPKPLLRRTFRDLVPRHVWNRPKQGFGVPVDTWFDEKLGERYADEVLGVDARLPDLLVRRELRRVWEEHRTGVRRHGPRLWTLLTMERWLRDLGTSQPLRRPPDAGIAIDAS